MATANLTLNTVTDDSAPTLRVSTTLDSSTLSPSLLSDLKRFGNEACDTELLPVLAASIRHLKPLIMFLQHGDRVIALRVLPREQQFRCSLDLCALPAADASRLRLVHVGPIPPAESAGLAGAGATHTGALAPLLWQLALHGARGELLPEIAGPARYRLARGLPLRLQPMDTWSLALLHRLRSEALTLEELAPQAELAQARARRLLNAIYLQGRLMITRSLPVQRPASVSRRLAA